MHNSQELANAIKMYAKSKNINVGKILKDCELSINTLSSMQSGGYYPRLEALYKIADYLDVSIDYLLGRTDVPEVNRNRSGISIVSSNTGKIQKVADSFTNDQKPHVNTDKDKNKPKFTQ